MNTIFNQEIIYFYSIPFFLSFILFEVLYSYLLRKQLYITGDTLTNLFFAGISMLVDLLVKGLVLLMLSFFYFRRLFDFERDWWYWVSCFIIQDFCYYIAHYVYHRSRFFWAMHVMHHNSEKFNITTGFRANIFEPLTRYVFFIPLAWLGFEPLHIIFVYAVGQMYGTLVHTQSIGKLGLLEWILVTPSHHRVHHASNVKYLDQNMGMVLILWDKIFGTFQREERDEPVKYGLTKPVEDRSPWNMIVHEWRELWQDITQPDLSLTTRLRYIFYPPGWRHDGTSKTSKMLQKELIRNKSV